MQTRRIGSLEVSVVGLGCNNFGVRSTPEQSTAVVRAALDAGINFFDTADIYGGARSEGILGAALGRDRDSVVVATKFRHPYEGHAGGASPSQIRVAVEASLRKLDTDRIDLYQLHSPDDDVPIADTLGALNELVAAGKVREIGCSNFSVDQLREAEAAAAASAGARFVSVQNEYSLLERGDEAGVLPECERTDTAYLPFFPLAKGLLTGKYVGGEAPPAGTRLATFAPEVAADLLQASNLAKVDALRAVAEDEGHTVLELAIAWLLTPPGGGLGHQRGQPPRPGPGERRRRRLDGARRGAGPGRRDRARLSHPTRRGHRPQASPTAVTSLPSVSLASPNSSTVFGS